MTFFGSTFKKARRLSIKVPLENLHISKQDFSPASFHKDLHNHKHVVSYNPTSLFNYGFINPKGSILSWGVVFRTVFMCGIGTLASQFTCQKGQNFSFCYPIVISSEGLIFAGLVSFLLGLFISTTFSRWWSVREKLGIIMNTITSLSILMHNFAPRDEESLLVVKKVIRWMHLGHSLIYKQANNDNDYSDLIDSKIATEQEVEILNSEFRDINHPPIVYSWVTAALQPLLPKALTSAVISPTLACVTASINASQEISALIKTQMPYMYLHLLALTTKIHLILIIFYAGGMISQGITDHLWTRIMFGYTVIITNNVIYEGLLRVHQMLYNPLGDDNADFPTDLYQSSTIALGGAIILPPPQEQDADNNISINISN